MSHTINPINHNNIQKGDPKKLICFALKKVTTKPRKPIVDRKKQNLDQILRKGVFFWFFLTIALQANPNINIKAKNIYKTLKTP